MPDRKAPKLTPAEQRKLFKQAARDLGTDDSEDVLDKVLRKVASAPPPKTIKQRKADIERRKQLVGAGKTPKPKRR